MNKYKLLLGLFILAAMLILAGAAVGQQTAISPARAQEIIHALAIRGYHGDMTSSLKQVAIDHHWQHVSVPDSRVIIWLGLGPHYTKLLNPKTAWVSTPKTVATKGALK